MADESQPPPDRGNRKDRERDDEGWSDSLRGMSDAVRRAVSSRIKSVVQNEDLRQAVSDAIPREMMGYVTRQVDAAKDEVVRMVGNQTRKFLENLDLGNELQKILTSVSFEIRTEVRFIPNEKGVRPGGKVGVRVKRQRPVPDAEGDEVTETEVREVRPTRERINQVRDGVRRTVDSVLGVFVRPEGEGPVEVPLEDEAALPPERRKRMRALRDGLLAAVDTVLSAWPREDDDDDGGIVDDIADVMGDAFGGHDDEDPPEQPTREADADADEADTSAEASDDEPDDDDGVASDGEAGEADAEEEER